MEKICLQTLMLGMVILSSHQTFITYDQYIAKYKLNFSDSETAQRQANFAQTITALTELALNTTLTWTPDVTKFAAWSSVEVAELKGLLLKQNVTEDQVSSGPIPPSSFDWRDQNKVSQVKYQENCGSDWAFAAVAYAESKLLIDGRYDTISLSEQRLLECTSDSNCSGGYLENAFGELLKQVPFQLVYPYKPSQNGSSDICSASGVQIGNSVENYYNLTDSELIDLLVERPVAISVSATGWEYYSKGVMQCNPNDPVDHAVLLVGYTADVWIVKNSWGSDWGEKGYIRVSRESQYNCKIGNSAHRTFEWRLGLVLGALLWVFLALL